MSPPEILYEGFRDRHLEGILSLIANEGWKSFTEDAHVTRRVLTAPGSCTIVALDGQDVVGFAQTFSDGHIQAWLSLIAVARPYRRMGIGSRLVKEAFSQCGGTRIDLLTDDDAAGFYRSFDHKQFLGFRIYPKEHPHQAQEVRR